MRAEAPLVIAITGADASGKDTQLAKLREFLENRQISVQVFSIWDALREFAGVSDAAVTREVLDCFLLRFEPRARSCFVASLLRQALAAPRSPAQIHLLNGHYYKYRAVEIAYGSDAGLWDGLAEELFPVPDLTFYLDVKLATRLGRRAQWSDYESGRAGKARGAEGLEAFQTRVHDALVESLIGQPAVYSLNGDRPVAEIAREIQEVVAARLGLFQDRADSPVLASLAFLAPPAPPSPEPSP